MDTFEIIKLIVITLMVGLIFGLLNWFLNPPSHSLNETSTAKSEKTTQVSLAAFIEVNHKLLTTLGVFMALTVYAGNLQLKPIGYFLAFLFLMGTVLIGLELWSRFPKGGTHSLMWFENVLFFSVLALVTYWLLEFRSFWRTLLFVPIASILLWLGSLIIKRYNIFNRIFHAKPETHKPLRYLFGSAVVGAILFLAIEIAFLVSRPLNDWLDALAKQLASQGLSFP